MESRHLLERFGSPWIPKLLKDTLDCIENVLMTSVKTKTVTNDLKAMQFDSQVLEHLRKNVCLEVLL